MKQSISLSLIVSTTFMIILCIIGLTLCVKWELGDYIPLTIVVCTIGVTMLAAYADKVEEQETQEVSKMLAMAFIQEVEQNKEYTLEEAQEMENGIVCQEDIDELIKQVTRV